MNHDIFISYSSKQKSIADGVCHYLEENGFKCWMAPRDISVGSEYGDLIEEAIKTCKVVVLVFSEAASISKWVKGEINVAFTEDKPILPFRVDETEIKGGFRVMLNQMHWIDAFPRYADRLPDLLNSVCGFLGRQPQKVSNDNESQEAERKAKEAAEHERIEREKKAEEAKLQAEREQKERERAEADRKAKEANEKRAGLVKSVGNDSPKKILWMALGAALIVATVLFFALKKKPASNPGVLMTQNALEQQGGNAIEGAAKGVFSVGNGDRVFFAKGNLQYQVSTHTWLFAENQWDYIGEANEERQAIDLFGWGTGNNPMEISENNSDYSSFVDWGRNPISNGGNRPDLWRTLSDEEWGYVIDQRSTASGIRFAKAKVNNVNGLILLPDGWDAGFYSLNNADDKEADFDGNEISPSVWASSLEAHGAVFLPAAGYRIGTTVGDAGSYGDYWSSTYYDSNLARYLYFYSGYVYPQFNVNRYYGFSVRLVCPAE